MGAFLFHLFCIQHLHHCTLLNSGIVYLYSLYKFDYCIKLDGDGGGGNYYFIFLEEFLEDARLTRWKTFRKINPNVFESDFLISEVASSTLEVLSNGPLEDEVVFSIMYWH